MLCTETITVRAMCHWFVVLNGPLARAAALGLRIVHNRRPTGRLTLTVLLKVMVLYARPTYALFHTVWLQPATRLPMLGLTSMVLWADEPRKLAARHARPQRSPR